jgi:hypothetical protein
MVGKPADGSGRKFPGELLRRCDRLSVCGAPWLGFGLKIPDEEEQTCEFERSGSSASDDDCA